MSYPGLHRSGDRAVLIDTPEGESPKMAGAIRAAALAHEVPVVDVVPGACSVLIVVASPADLGRLADLLANVDSSSFTAAVQLPPVELHVRYDGPDLKAVAQRIGRSVEEVITMHSNVTYKAAFCGFAPGFVYLTGLPPLLRLPRRESPRPNVPAGSVAIADTYTAVYPRSSPGGWHLLGTADAVLWDAEREPAALISAGASVRFLPIDRR